ncbi:hypothetical protein HII36_43510 [Nonomuraea sp. NN258]|uniref:FixH family protein n=1 Tax=Nonomuraea antri TaxID=2730852 RepID=UPI001569D573|nr:hypothetical protein [Nonomuraea antri]NRQ38646.1 hypothetical protein [Nonomuraea antri]
MTDPASDAKRGAVRWRVAAVAVLVVGVVAVLLGNLGGTAEPVTVNTSGAHYAISVAVERPAAGRVAVEVRVTSGQADSVAVSAVMPDMGHAMPEVAAGRQEPGRFRAEGEMFPMAGVWELSIRLDGPAGAEVLVAKALIDD